MFGRRKGRHVNDSAGFGNRRKRGVYCPRRVGELNLNSALANHRYVIMSNPDRKTVEMGIFPGGIITVHKNDLSDSNLIVTVGNTRYILPRELAGKILIR